MPWKGVGGKPFSSVPCEEGGVESAQIPLGLWISLLLQEGYLVLPPPRPLQSVLEAGGWGAGKPKDPFISRSAQEHKGRQAGP